MTPIPAANANFARTVLGVLVLGTTLLHAAEPTACRSVALNVAAAPAQTLEGFGCSMSGTGLSEGTVPDSARTEMFDQVFGDLHMNVLRLWVGTNPTRTVAQMKERFYKTYVDNGIIADAQKRGVTTLLLAPARGEKPPTEPMSEYVRKLKDSISDVKAERGIHINVTGIANEPDGFKPEQLAEAVRVLRRELDAADLKDVQIIAPEWANGDDAALRAIAGIKADPAAWAALRGIATHSYNMAATPKFPKTIAGTEAVLADRGGRHRQRGRGGRQSGCLHRRPLHE
jgi:O-glycosyl hydrolase